MADVESERGDAAAALDERAGAGVADGQDAVRTENEFGGSILFVVADAADRTLQGTDRNAAADCQSGAAVAGERERPAAARAVANDQAAAERHLAADLLIAARSGVADDNRSGGAAGDDSERAAADADEAAAVRGRSDDQRRRRAIEAFQGRRAGELIESAGAGAADGQRGGAVSSADNEHRARFAGGIDVELAERAADDAEHYMLGDRERAQPVQIVAAIAVELVDALDFSPAADEEIAAHAVRAECLLERAHAGAADGLVPAGTGLQDSGAEDVGAAAVEVAADLQRRRAHRAAALQGCAEHAALHESADAVAADDEAGEGGIRAGNRQLGAVTLRGIEIKRAGTAVLGADEQRVDVEHARAAERIGAARIGAEAEFGRADNDAVGNFVSAARLNKGPHPAVVLADEFAESAGRRGAADRHRQQAAFERVATAAAKADFQRLRDRVRAAALDEAAAVAEADEFEAALHPAADDGERAIGQCVVASLDLDLADRVGAAELLERARHELGGLRPAQRAT